MAVEDVATVKNQLINKYGPNSCDGACGAFKITSTVAWNLRNDGWGLIFSTGNGCAESGTNYRADTIMRQDGTVIDLLILAENNNGRVYPAVSVDSYNVPSWNATGSQPPGNWRAPYDPGLVDGVNPPPDNGGGTNPPGNGGNADLVAVMRKLDELDVQLKEIRNTQMNQDKLIVETQEQVCVQGYSNRIIGSISPK